jgi:predicted aconitase with swiveling domain
MLARGAHVARVPMAKETWIDELAESHHTDVDREDDEEQAAI